MCKYTVFKIWMSVSLLSLFGFQADVHAGSDSDKVKENISTLQKTKACPGCDLSGADLNRMNLSGANLQGADLTDAKLYLVNFSGADLRNAHLQRAGLGGADLAGADLRGADLRGAELNGAYLEGSKFDGEFVKTKPYEEEGTPEIEKKSNVDDTVKPKKSVGNVEKKADHKIVNVQKTTHDQKPDQSVVPSLKADEPIKNILVSENLQPSTDVHDQTNKGKNEDLPQTQEKKLKGAAGSAKETVQNDGSAKEDGREQAKPITAISANPSHDAKSLPATVENEGHEHVGNTPNVAGGKTSVDEDSSINASGKDKTVVEKDLLKEKQIDKQNNTATATKKAEEISSDKADTIKKLLKTKKCYQCDLAGVDLSDKNLGEADLEGANLTGSNLEKADLSKAVLKGAVLVDANLKKANLKGADLYRANLSGADLTEANMENAKIDGTLFVGAIGR